MRLIDAGALIAEMHNVILEDGEDRRTFYEVIERQPTIAQPEIINCCDCEYRSGQYCHNKNSYGAFIRYDHFCGYAVRREEEEDEE